MTKRLLPLLLVALAACPKDKEPRTAARDSIPTVASLDTVPQDLSSIQSNIPAAAPDTFRQRSAGEIARATGGSTGGASRGSAGGGGLPEAPAPLLAAVQREQSFTRFCYQEFGQKHDPSLAGNVAMVVSIGDGGVTDTKVGNSSWTSGAGRAVNSCIADKAKAAWKVEPGAVRPGRYVVQLSFRGA